MEAVQPDCTKLYIHERKQKFCRTYEGKYKVFLTKTPSLCGNSGQWKTLLQ